VLEYGLEGGKKHGGKRREGSDKDVEKPKRDQKNGNQGGNKKKTFEKGKAAAELYGKGKRRGSRVNRGKCWG